MLSVRPHGHMRVLVAGWMCEPAIVRFTLARILAHFAKRVVEGTVVVCAICASLAYRFSGMRVPAIDPRAVCVKSAQHLGWMGTRAPRATQYVACSFTQRSEIFQCSQILAIIMVRFLHAQFLLVHWLGCDPRGRCLIRAVSLSIQCTSRHLTFSFFPMHSNHCAHLVWHICDYAEWAYECIIAMYLAPRCVSREHF